MFGDKNIYGIHLVTKHFIAKYIWQMQLKELTTRKNIGLLHSFFFVEITDYADNTARAPGYF